MEDGGQERTSGQPVQVEKEAGSGYPKPSRAATYRHSSFGQMRLLALGTKGKYLCCFKPLCSWQFFTAAIEKSN